MEDSAIETKTRVDVLKRFEVVCRRIEFLKGLQTKLMDEYNKVNAELKSYKEEQELLEMLSQLYKSQEYPDPIDTRREKVLAPKIHMTKHRALVLPALRKGLARIEEIVSETGLTYQQVYDCLYNLCSIGYLIRDHERWMIK